MRALTAKQIIRILTENGFGLSRQRDSHAIYRHPLLNISVPVPIHGGNKPLPLGTFLAIVKQSRLPKTVFQP